MKLEMFDLRLDREGATYLAGEEVSGTLYINATQSVILSRIIVKLTGVVHTGWTNKISTVTYESNEEIMHECMDATKYFTIVSDGVLLPMGEHSIKFNFKLKYIILFLIPLDVASSMHNDYFGWVRYTCSALLTISDNFIRQLQRTTTSFGCFMRLGGSYELVVDKPITVFSVLNVYAPHFRRPSIAEDSVELVRWCAWQGILSAEMMIAEQGILPGETAKITLTIEDGSRKRKKARCPVVALCQQLDFKSQNPYVLELYDEKSLTLVVDSIGVGYLTPGKGLQLQVKHLNFAVPIGLPPTSTKTNGLITVSYFFKLYMDDFQLVTPVVIGSWNARAGDASVV